MFMYFLRARTGHQISLGEALRDRWAGSMACLAEGRVIVTALSEGRKVTFSPLRVGRKEPDRTTSLARRAAWYAIKSIAVYATLSNSEGRTNGRWARTLWRVSRDMGATWLGECTLVRFAPSIIANRKDFCGVW